MEIDMGRFEGIREGFLISWVKCMLYYYFGSHTRAFAEKESDIDILVKLEKKLILE